MEGIRPLFDGDEAKHCESQIQLYSSHRMATGREGFVALLSVAPLRVLL